MQSTSPRLLTLTLAAGVLLGIALLATDLFRASTAAPLAQASAGGQDAQAADKEAIRKTSAALIKALESGDAKAVAALWTENGEYFGGDGTTIRGRAAIAKSYAEHFKENPKIKILRSEVESLRFLSKDTAVEEGMLTVQKSASGLPVTNRYTILHVREDGKWLIALVREGRGETTNLRDLDWLVGRWAATHDGVEMQADVEWTLDKAFLQMRFTVKAQGQETHGMQIIGRDPATGQMRAWTFESEGGFGHAIWSRDGKSWIIEASGVQADGSILTATNVMTPIDNNAFTWQSTHRSVDGDNLADLPPVRVNRVKTGK